MITDDHFEELAIVLAVITDQGDGMLLSEFDGFCTALAIGPELILPSEWLPVVWGGDGSPESASSKELKRALELIMGHYNDVISLLNQPDESFSPVYNHDEQTGDIYWEAWVEGFERAMRLRPDAWASIAEVPEGMPYPKVGVAVSLMLELALLREGSSELPEAMLAALIEDVPQTIAEIVSDIQAWTLANSRPAPYPSMAAANQPHVPTKGRKLGRNDPCPCGSGRKYKKCCGAN
jgi:uncharacterized protein